VGGLGFAEDELRPVAHPEQVLHPAYALADQIAFLLESRRGLRGGMFRINPHTDDASTPDSLWYLSLAGSLDGAQPGSGVRSVDLCFW
jgi:hypothetical protein